MDILVFLEKRTRFIPDFYANASFPFTEQKRKIEAGEDPFAPPCPSPYGESEDKYPTFQFEWIEADESLDVLGQMCISTLATALHLYLKQRIGEIYHYYGDTLTELGIARPGDNKSAFKQGWINGYRTFFADKLKIRWEDGPSNLALLEEIVLTRNRAQHPDRISTIRIRQTEQDFSKHPRAFFADEFEIQYCCDPQQPEEEWLLQPWRLNITKDKLFKAIEDVERFCDWLDRSSPNGTSA